MSLCFLRCQIVISFTSFLSIISMPALFAGPLAGKPAETHPFNVCCSPHPPAGARRWQLAVTSRRLLTLVALNWLCMLLFGCLVYARFLELSLTCYLHSRLLRGIIADMVRVIE